MAPRKSSFRARATSLIRSPLATIHQGQLHDPSNDRRSNNQSQSTALNEKQGVSDNSRDASSASYAYGSTGEDAHVSNNDTQRAVRTIPAWVYTRDQIEGGPIDGLLQLHSPAGAYLAHHNSNPSARRHGNIHLNSSQQDEIEPIPPWPSASPANGISQWRAFANATAYPRVQTEDRQIVSEEWLRQNGPDYDMPWLAGNEEGDSENGMAELYRSGPRRRVWYLRLQRTILRSPVIPMVIRMVVFGFSMIALGLASSIHHITDAPNDVVGQTPSTDMAIIVDAVALVYLLYITYDEYSGKPLGLRSARAKMRLIFLDLFFIVFDSANLSLAFVSIRDTNCDNDTRADEMCTPQQVNLFNEILMRQRALASVLLIALIAWLLTFSISVAR